MPSDQGPVPLSDSQMAPPTAYRMGIIHFRSLYSFIRLLPAYKLYRRLRRLNTGLRLGIKLWGPEGYEGAKGLAEAWDVIERDLIGIDVPLERMIAGIAEESPSSVCEKYEFPPLDLFGSRYEQSVLYRPNIDFDVEDKESVLSERFVDMEEEWFTPTVARHRLEAEARASASASVGTGGSDSRPPTANPTPPPGVTVPGSSLRNITTASTSARATPPGAGTKPASLGSGKWGALAENLPFAVGQSATPPSPTVMTPGTNPISYRRLSAHSIQPFRSISASPSTSILRMAPGTPTTPSFGAQQSGRAIPTAGSIGRTSSFLSQSGRSFSHAQLANMQGASASPPVASGLGSSPPLNFSKQALPGSLSRVSPHMIHSTSSPFVPSSMERDSPFPGSSPSQLTKRHSSALAPRRSVMSGSPDMQSVPMVRRTSTRESSLRPSLEEARPDNPDNDDVHAFLRALDSWTPPPSLIQKPSPRVTAIAGPGPSISTTSATPGGLDGSPATGSVSGSAGASAIRAPLTKQHVDDMLKRMAESFSPALGSGSQSAAHTSRRNSNSNSASDCATAPSAPSPSGMPIRTSTLRQSGVPSPPGLSAGQGSIPRGSPGSLRSSPLRNSPGVSLRPQLGITPEEPASARSLPDANAPVPLSSMLSPQTTGGLGQRRPVLVRGGFGPASSKASTSSSPSHSPIRYRSGLQAERERSEQRGERERRHYREVSAPALRARRTAPSSLGAETEEVLVRGRVASEGNASPAAGLMARLAAEHERELATGIGMGP